MSRASRDWTTIRRLAGERGGMGWVSALACVVIAIALARSGARIAGDALARSPIGDATPAAGPDRATSITRSFDAYAAQIRGRSLFFVPSPPPPPEVEDRPREPETPPPPSRYGGPALVGMLNDTAWFGDGRRLSVGDESDPALQVIRLDAPWSAQVRWKSVEFTVMLFERDRIVIPRAEPPPPASTPPTGGPPAPEAPKESAS